MVARPTTSMKEGWLCRTSYDEKNHEIAHMMMTRWWSRLSDDPDPVQCQWWWSRSRDDSDPVMMTPRDPDRVMIQIEQWWSISSDDLDPAVMIQIERWSKSSDDPDPVQWWWSRSSDDPDPVMMIQIERWSRSSVDYQDREMIQIRRMKMNWRLKRLEM